MSGPDLSAWYTDEYVVYHKDIDARSELRLTALLLMLQETAWNHAHCLGIGYDSKGFENLIWVLSRMRIELLGPGPEWMEKVRLATSPTGVDRLFALRDFQAMRADGSTFARVASAWILIDDSTRKPIRPQSLLDGGNFRFYPPVLPEGTVKLREPETPRPGLGRTATWSDIDAHQHVNNVKYAEWCLDGYPQDHWDRYRLVEYDVNFNAEMTWGQDMTTAMAVETRPEDGAANWEVAGHHLAERHTHVIRETSVGKTATLVRLGWEHRLNGDPHA